MFHMLTCFDIKPGKTLDAFQQALDSFTDHMRSLDLVESRGPIGLRQSNTILDTDEERTQQYFMLMHFKDKAQSDRAVDYIYTFQQPGDTIHRNVYADTDNMIFICWEDIDSLLT